MTITLQALSLVEKAEPVQVRFTLCLRDQRSYVNARWMESVHGFLHDIKWIVGSWSIGLIFFLNHLLEVGLKQNWGIMGLRTLTTVDLSYLVMCEEPHEHKFIEIAFGLGSSTYEFTLH